MASDKLDINIETVLTIHTRNTMPPVGSSRQET